MLTPDELLGHWPDKPIADLVEADFETVFADEPEIVLLGTGATQYFSAARADVRICAQGHRLRSNGHGRGCADL